MLYVRLFSLALFAVALALAAAGLGSFRPTGEYWIYFGIYLLFSILYNHLRFISKKGKTEIEYGINYGLSLSLYAGLTGLFLFEIVYRFANVLYRKLDRYADPEEWSDFFYNVGSFVLQNSVAFFLFSWLTHGAGDVHGALYWVAIAAAALLTGFLSDTLIVVSFVLEREIRTWKEAIDLYKTRTPMAIAQTALTNGLLYYFIAADEWLMLIGLFLLNYLASYSMLFKAQSIQARVERDNFEKMAYTDHLTGVHNRTYMEKVIQTMEGGNEPIGIVVTDIDRFKSINDTYNHSVGDRVIRHFADTMKATCAEHDIVIRTGGEEFTILLRGRSYDDCLDFCERLRRDVEESVVEAEFGGARVDIRYTASFGVYFRTGGSETPLASGYVHADNLLLQSKQQGRNRIAGAREAIA
ncbi:GGDEF domain-containing protein [Paenibacillus sp.]|uniref:GGDEF domain-containing protein n=1 Tax=Paenibacillus sp. TaxID=58172 RepID=UPI0028115EFD|nr:GGDEF domain-containing protein [Paenibacillus sp.]